MTTQSYGSTNYGKSADQDKEVLFIQTGYIQNKCWWLGMTMVAWCLSSFRPTRHIQISCFRINQKHPLILTLFIIKKEYHRFALIMTKINTLIKMIYTNFTLI